MPPLLLLLVVFCLLLLKAFSAKGLDDRIEAVSILLYSGSSGDMAGMKDWGKYDNRPTACKVRIVPEHLNLEATVQAAVDV